MTPPAPPEPRYASLLATAAIESARAGAYAQAEALAKLALATEPANPELHYLLGHAQYRLSRYQDAEHALRRSILIDPNHARANNDLAAALFALGRDEDAIRHIRAALRLDPTLPEAEETEAIWLLRQGRFREAWPKYEARYRTEKGQGLRRDFACPQWQGEPIAGRTILLHAEQGFGDAIQFARYVPLVAQRGARVILEVHRGLGRLMAGLTGAQLVLERGQTLPHADLHCPLLSLPLIFGTDLDSIPASVPYLAAQDALVFKWRAHLGPRRGLRIGIVWSGNPAHRDDRRRTIPLGRFARLLAPRDGCEFHVLQAAVRQDDKPVLASLPHVRDHSLLMPDFADTAALVSLMDVVISVDTSVAHLAGALGWPVWLLLPAMPDWRWMLGRDDSPWYPTFWLFRQRSPGDWDDVLGRVAQQLNTMLT
ncbi:MAG: tetratricopeptide repeat protein [Acetobacteraceae bacterium]